jgi:gamma-glutamyltranspeptidase/glutathione hydrolase
MHGMVATVDHLASEAGVSMLRDGGNAVDAAIAANAVLAVTAQHMCGLGGDLFALVYVPGETVPRCLNASGRSGFGADAEALRAEGHAAMPFTGDIRTVTVPGCVDGWAALNEEFGSMALADVLAPACRYAENGFPASPLLVAAAPAVASLPSGRDFEAATVAGAVLRRPGAVRALEAVASGGRAGFYLGEFGEGLLRLGRGLFDESDLTASQAEWVTPLSLDVWGHRLWTTPPNSQGYLTLTGAAIAERAGLAGRPDDPDWAHLGVEAARVAAFDRPEVLHEHADVAALLDDRTVTARAAAIDPRRAAARPGAFDAGDTTYLCAVDDDGLAVSLIQSNAAGFGALIAEPSTGIFLHNRGIGFSLVAGHPAEYGPGRRPPHTLSPALVTTPAGDLRAVLGTMGGDAQPQILLQLAARLLHAGEEVGAALAARRWALSAASHRGGFETWADHGEVLVHLEEGVPDAWAPELTRRGHQVVTHPYLGYNFGHGQAIRITPEGVLEGASDPRCLVGDAAGY